MDPFHPSQGGDTPEPIEPERSPQLPTRVSSSAEESMLNRGDEMVFCVLSSHHAYTSETDSNILGKSEIGPIGTARAEIVADVHADDGLDIDNLTGHLRDLSVGISEARSGDSYIRDLRALAYSQYTQFQQSDDPRYINEAIHCFLSAVTRMSNSHVERPTMLKDLGGAYLARFNRLEELPDLEKSIQCSKEAISLTHDSHPDKPSMLNNLGISYRHRFEHLADLNDLGKAIDRGVQAVALIPNGHPDKPGTLDNLGNSYRTQFRYLGDLDALSKAIECGEQAVLLTPDGDLDKPGGLKNLGISYRTRFQRLGDLIDLDKAIECGEQAMALTPDHHPDKPGMLNSLGISYRHRFERLSDLTDLRKAIGCGIWALSLTSNGHPDKIHGLNSLGSSYLGRFQRLGTLGDLDKAIEYTAQAVYLIPSGHPDRPSGLSNVGGLYLTRFQYLGDMVNLDKAIEYITQAVFRTPNGHPSLPGNLSNLGTAYRTRFERLGDLVDLNEAIECAAQVVSLTPDGHVDRPRRLGNLGATYLARFQRTGHLVDLNESIICAAKAVFLTPNNHTEKPHVLDKLGNSYYARFERLGSLADLDKSIKNGARAVSLTVDGHPEKPYRLNNLGNSYLARFRRLGDLTDLNKAIECTAATAALVADSDPDRPAGLSNLGISYLTRFHRLGDPVDLNKAIECLAQAVLLTPEDNPDRLGWLSNLSAAYLARFQRLDDLVDLDESIRCGTQAALLTPEDHADIPNRLNNLVNAYLSRFQRLSNMVDIDQAIERGARVVALTPDDHPNKPRSLNNLGNSYLTRFQHLNHLVDLDKAIELNDQAVSRTPNDHAGKSSRLSNLGIAYSARYGHSHEVSDLESVLSCFQTAAQSLSGPPSAKFHACRRWAQWASLHPASSPYPAYQRAIELLPQLIWIGTTLGQRYGLIAEIGDFATEAASYAISVNEFDVALEWLEVGRSIVWGQIAQLRTPFGQLADYDPDLANRLKEVSNKLENAGFRSSSALSAEETGTSLDEEASHHIKLALDWDQLLNKARAIRGFEDFLQPRKSATLLSAARFNPVAVINVHESRCDALILRPNNSTIMHVHLTEFSVGSVLAARKHLASQARQRKIGRLNRTGFLEGSLEDMWFCLLKPILDVLGYNCKLPVEELPRLTWCTTGLLSFLPLHAAGCHDGSENNALDVVVSSYTPTLSALLAHQSVDPSTHCGVLAIGQEHTPGLESLPGTTDELATIQKHAHAICYLKLENNEATIDQVLEAMDQFNWVHLACHGSQNTTDPTQSAFHLHGGNLTLATITKRSFGNKGLAFLSACQTATGDKGLPEEAVHLAAGMLMAGFPSVIATMWSISDGDAPQVADKVYASLLADGNMDFTDAPRALHKAVVELRATVGETAFERWAPFIHIGC